MQHAAHICVTASIYLVQDIVFSREIVVERSRRDTCPCGNIPDTYL